jgi:hypothetical protein
MAATTTTTYGGGKIITYGFGATSSIDRRRVGQLLLAKILSCYNDEFNAVKVHSRIDLATLRLLEFSLLREASYWLLQKD